VINSLTPEEAAKNSNFQAPADGSAVAYVCMDRKCAPPATTADSLVQTIRSYGREAADSNPEKDVPVVSSGE
jgi:uncharacterized protein YyaL (SSP411 family)